MKRQSGLSLVAVAVIMAILAGVVMFGMMSMRQEKNLFAEGMDKVGAKAAAAVQPVAAPSAPLRKCVINGKTVISNTDCRDTGKVIEVHETRGIESPKAPKPAPQPEQGVRDKMVERAAQ